MSVAGPVEVRFSDPALDDLDRLFDFQLENAQAIEDLVVTQRAIDEIKARCDGSLSKTPFSHLRTGSNSLRRELIVPFGSAGYVAQYEIEPATLRVIVLAVRHQREDDYH